MMTQNSLEQKATAFLRSKNLRWDGRNFADPKNAEKAKAQVAFERRLVVCPFSGKSIRRH